MFHQKLFLTLALVLFVFTSCVKSGTDSTTEQSTSATNSPGVGVTESEITITGRSGAITASAYTASLGEILTCSASCTPPATSYTWLVSNATDTSTVSGAVLVVPTNTSLIGKVYSGKCTVTNLPNGVLATASKTLTVTIGAQGCWSKLTFTALALQLLVALSLINRASTN